MSVPSPSAHAPVANVAPGATLEVLRVFTRLGLTSFGGPIAHIGYFHDEFVVRRRWLSDAQFGQLLALCQFLPGPASSQMGFSIGLLRAGWLGALAAFVAFTLPSALVLFALAAAGAWMRSPVGDALTHGLKLVAVVVVAHGLIRMAHAMCPDALRATLAGVVAVVVLLVAAPWVQLAVIAAGAVVGLALVRPDMAAAPSLPVRHGRRAARLALLSFALGLAGALLWPTSAPVLGSIWAAFWRAGSLVFGGGHVVLPLLEQSVVHTGWVSGDVFLAGYGAAQAVPGPMFSLAAFLGAAVPTGAAPALGAAVATLAVFAPGFLLVVGILPAWSRLTASRSAAGAVAGMNAAVVGLLAAALYDPVWVSAIRGVADVAVVAVGLGLLWRGGRSPLWAVGWCVLAGGGLALINLS
jgi:chromate transporter